MKQSLRRILNRSLLPGLLIALIVPGLLSNAQTDLVTIRPLPDTESYLPNPGIGWQQSAGNPREAFPETVIYANRADISWRVLNPAPNTYDWSALDNLLERAVAEEKQLSFRVYTMRGERWNEHQVPEWVASQPGVILRSGEPNYSSCIYQEHWATFVNELRARYDGNSDIAYIDISGYGNFNEWSWQDQTLFDDDALNPSSLDGQARRRLADLFIGGEKSDHFCIGADGGVQLVSYSYPGFQTTQLVMPFAGIRQSTQYVADRRSDVGIRHDCLSRPGSAEGVITSIGAQIEATWRNAPIIFEFCSNYTTEDRFMDEADTLLRFAHGSLVHDNATRRPQNLERLQSLLQFIGYRYQLTELTYPRSVQAGESLNLRMIWHNVGYAPSYPRMGQRFALWVYLLDESENIIAQAQLSTAIEEWMPADPLPGQPPDQWVEGALPVPPGLNGRYSLRVAIIDERTSKPIHLAIRGRDARGYYTIGDIDVVSPPA